MAHASPDFETKDVLGVTQHFNGVVGNSPVLIPNIADKKISRVVVRSSNSNSFNRILKVAIDGGASYWNLQVGEVIEWLPKNDSLGNPIKQIALLGDPSNTDYEVIMDFEP